MPTFTTSLIVNRGTSAPISKEVATTADGETVREVTVPASTNDVLVSMAVDVSHLKEIAIVASKAITLETNSSSDPDETILLLANVPFHWRSADGYFANPFAGDITAIYLSNLSAGDGTVKIWVLQDSTPA